MSGAACEAWQHAVYEALTEDMALMALVTGVFDRVPEGTALPYVTFGRCDSMAEDNASATGQRIRLEVHAYSRTGGRKESLAIVQRLYSVLHLQPLELDSGLRVVWMRMERSRVEMQRDGMTWHAASTLTALVEPV